MTRCYATALLGSPFWPAYCHGHKEKPDQPEGVILMKYCASPGDRTRLIAGFRALAEFLEENRDAPAPRWTQVMVFASDGSDEEMKAEIDRVAESIGAEIEDERSYGGHYRALRHFGPVEYSAVAISPYARHGDGATDETGA
jgi:hypothetical protein